MGMYANPAWQTGIDHNEAAITFTKGRTTPSDQDYTHLGPGHKVYTAPSDYTPLQEGRQLYAAHKPIVQDVNQRYASLGKDHAVYTEHGDYAPLQGGHQIYTAGSQDPLYYSTVKEPRSDDDSAEPGYYSVMRPNNRSSTSSAAPPLIPGPRTQSPQSTA